MCLWLSGTYVDETIPPWDGRVFYLLVLFSLYQSLLDVDSVGYLTLVFETKFQPQYRAVRVFVPVHFEHVKFMVPI
jgi:hypothetical protein